MEDAMLQFGISGLMGMLWLWERTHSRKREQQLTQAHEHLVRREEQFRLMLSLARKNTRALVEFERTQRRLGEVLEGIRNAIQDIRKKK